MKWPRELVIGNNVWTVRLVPRRMIDPERNSEGDCNMSLRRIRVARELSETKRWSVLLHELIHASLDTANLNGEVAISLGNLEEFIVERLEVNLYPMLRQCGWGPEE